MRWLIAGGLGFVGSNFIRLVLRERPLVEIINLDAMTYAGNPANLKDLEHHAHYRFVHGNICDSAAVEKAVSGGIDAIVNFAAETHVDRSIADPEVFLRTDVLGTLTLLEAQRRHGVARYLQVSTDEVYGSVSEGASNESDPLRPRNPYSASKAAADLQILAYRATFDAPVLITRGSNTYGPYQYPEKLIPLFITNLIEGNPVPLYGSGEQIRDWLHVEDHARGILHVLERGEVGNVYNLAGGNPRTNVEITKQLVDAFGGSMDRDVRYVADRPGHDWRYSICSDKANALGWRPRVPFEAGFLATIAWYREHAAWWRPLKGGHPEDHNRVQYAAR